jgi:hypothetical protein
MLVSQLTKVLFPEIGPHVAVYAAGMEPTMPPKTEQSAASKNPRP